MASARGLLIPGLCLLALGASATPADAAPRRCNALKAKKVVTTPAVRIVSVPVDIVSRKNGSRITGRDFLACARPRGTVRKIGFIYKEYFTTGSVKGMSPVSSGLTSFGTTAGTFVITRTREANLSGSYAERTYRVVDVATGRRYSYFHNIMTEEPPDPEPAPPVTLRLDDTGRLAAILSSPDDQGYSAPPVGRTQVVAFTRTGKRTVLDEAPVSAIPKASLTLSDGRIGWTNAGLAKSAPAP